MSGGISFTTSRVSALDPAPPQRRDRSAGRTGRCASRPRRSARARGRAYLLRRAIFRPASRAAFRNVYAIAPPIRIASTLGSRLRITPILSETFAPPSIAMDGCAGFSVTARNASSSRIIRKPAARSAMKLRDPRRRCVRAMRGAESVIDVDVLAARSSCEKSRSLASSSVMETQVLQQDRLARSPALATIRPVTSPMQSGASANLLPEHAGQVFGDRLEAQFRRMRSLGRPRCEQSTAAPPWLEDVADGIEAGVDARRIGDLPAFERHVEIASHEHLLAREAQGRVIGRTGIGQSSPARSRQI